MVKCLLEANAKPNKKDLGGNTPLILACSGGHHQVAALLLQVRALSSRQTRPSFSFSLFSFCGFKNYTGFLCVAVADLELTL